MTDTICALASGPPPAAIAIIRISGPETSNIAETYLKSGLTKPKQAVFTHFCDKDGTLIDEGITVFFKGPASYTGEDSLELYLHGGASVIAHALDTLTTHKNTRLAEPGEFTRRAFEAGKLDLTQAEGVADIIEAETLAQKSQALRQLGGGLSDIYEGWRDKLTEILALVEVSIDFPDDDEAPQNTKSPVAQRIDTLKDEIAQALGDRGIGEKIRDGFRVAIVGAPNAGKSTLLNALAGRDAAIVTSTPGTTRDIIEVRRIMGGQVVYLADTAGLRETEDEIEAEGVRRAKHAAGSADLRIFLYDAADLDDGANVTVPIPLQAGDLVVLNKFDTRDKIPSEAAHHYISAKTGDGIAGLETAIARFISTRAGALEAPTITRARHRAALQSAMMHLGAATERLMFDDGAELVAEDVRLAIRALGSVVGNVGVEDVLGAVFSQFCIGK